MFAGGIAIAAWRQIDDPSIARQRGTAMAL